MRRERCNSPDGLSLYLRTRRTRQASHQAISLYEYTYNAICSGHLFAFRSCCCQGKDGPVPKSALSAFQLSQSDPDGWLIFQPLSVDGQFGLRVGISHHSMRDCQLNICSIRIWIGIDCACRACSSPTESCIVERDTVKSTCSWPASNNSEVAGWCSQTDVGRSSINAIAVATGDS